LLPVLLSFSCSLSPREDLAATLLHLSFVFGFEFQIQTLSASFLRTAELQKLLFLTFPNSVCIFFLVPTGCVLHSRCLLLLPDCLSFTLCLHVRSHSTWVHDGTSYRTHPKQKATVGLDHSLSSHFLKLNLRTKYVSYVGGLPPLSHSLRFKIMLTHRD
jgi:hypothetical protein